MSLALQFAHPIVITQHFFFNSCKVQNGFLCILYLNAAGAAWQMWRCWCCWCCWWWAGVSWTDQIPPNCSCLWRDCCSPKSDLGSVNTCLQLHRQRHKQTLKSVLLSVFVKQTWRWQAGFVTSCSAFLVCNISRLAVCSCFCRYELQCMLRAFLLL